MNSHITDLLRSRVNDIWYRIFNHPFVIELFNGTLPLEKFRFYVIQDYNYLITLTKCQAIIASKFEDPTTMRKILELALADVSTELENYNKLLNTLNLSFDDAIRIRPSPTNIAYMNFLLTTCTLGSPYEGLVAILPCYWTYLEIARYHVEKLRSNPIKIYRDWASIYLTPEYSGIVDSLRVIIDKASDYLMRDFDKLLNIFRQASVYEYLFWDMAYRQEQWVL
ncbi:MAG: thiaminase II [Vulcanisaeta sp.]|jgi:thiaminase/transcriptional activator TenA|uniref:TenA family transcriptional activator n=1 Tax=Vulcanisaeta moutnovskia (strain 768-28) TaxID=985053 RepID=F0QWG5_VULM7|nr:thiaminase II [Vulcanisaeta moutnovskia]ADY01013.1 TenA family transcriptional activator [Vulcanisaeta moutnovskia 768-28]